MARCILLAVALLFIAPVVLQGQRIEVSSDSTIVNQFGRASALFMSGEMERSIPAYRIVFERERTRRTLTQPFWRVLIDNLGMAYGITGNLDSAESIFRYGIARDSTYPLFYYNLACTFAERDDLTNAMEQLRLAYAYKENMIEGETFPDPSNDSSFKRFMKNQQFLQLLQEVQRR